jgi:eukaryotic-like serine/threonine-protein kinase
MRQEPPKQLLELMERTGLATAGQVRGVGRRAKRLARRLPLFESVWVDALAQARIITRFQAVRINAGHGDSLRVGPYLLDRSLPSAGYVDCYQAREVESGGAFRLAIIEDCRFRGFKKGSGTVVRSTRPTFGQCPAVPATVPDPFLNLLGRLETLVLESSRLTSENLSPLIGAGENDGRVWAACRHHAGWSAADWMVHNGRFPPEVVLEIARRMLLGLIELEQAGFRHGDICSLGLTLTDKGRVVLSPPGLRGVVRPEEGYGLADLAPEYYDYLAPERVDAGTGPTIESDVYSAGCLWWHLLTGRPPVPGGSSLAKLRGHQTAKIPDVCQLAPDTSPRLAAAIRACCQRDPELRPQSMIGLSQMLGDPAGPGKTRLARCVTRGGSSATHAGVSVATIRRSRKTVLPMAVMAGSVIVAVAMLWSSWHAKGPVVATESPVEQPPASRPQIETPARLRTDDQTLAALPPNGQPDQPPIVGPPDGNPPAPSEAVLPAGYDVAPTRARPDSRPAERNVLVLSTKDPTKGESLQLAAGQHVRGAGGGRPVIEVPSHGLVVRPENVRFENIDFVWKTDSKQSPTGHRPAIIRLEASRVQFHGCSFQPAEAKSGSVAAIRWTHPIERNELDLPHGQIVIGNCVFHRVEAAVACETVGAVSLEFSNVLHLAGGPLVWLDHAPVQDEPVGIGLTNVALRESGPVMECSFTEIAGRPGNISIRANGSAFVIGPNSTLLSFSGPKSPDRLLSTLYWSGQGSLVSPQTVIAGWRRADGQTEVLDDAAVSMAGLVRSKVGFAGSVEDGPAASQIIEWQVPLRTSDPPGIDPRSLSWCNQ